jgi:hypothetical protein
MSSLLHQQSQSLIAMLTAQCTTGYGFGSMSPSIYDTAWLSMVEKKGTWLFPECFDFILAHQLPCGAWDSYASPVDGILNTAAALLVLKRRLNRFHNHPDWLPRSHRAEAALGKMLDSWDVNSSDQVGSRCWSFSFFLCSRMRAPYCTSHSGTHCGHSKTPSWPNCRLSASTKRPLPCTTPWRVSSFTLTSTGCDAGETRTVP